ncbi:hypothetical protein, partial [Streptomyces boncukensis]
MAGTSGLAARVEAWRRRAGAWATPASGPGQTVVTHPVVEMLLGTAWTDISEYVRYAEGVSIRWGRSDESTRLQPAQCDLTLDNRDGRFSPRNPAGAYYGLIGRNTPLRVWTQQGEIRRWRFTGELGDLPPRWDSTGTDVYVPVEAAGITRRLGQQEDLHSPLRRGLSRAAGLVAYWPCEEPSGATQFASGIVGDPAMTFTGSPRLSSASDYPGSESIPQVNGSIWRGQVPMYTETGESQVRALVAIDDDGLTDGVVLLRVRTSGSASIWHVVYTSATNGGLHLSVGDQDGNIIETSGTFTGVNGLLMRMSLAMEQDGADIDYALRVHTAADPPVTGWATGTIAGYTFDTVSSVVVAKDGDAGGTGSPGDVAVGHVSVQDVVTSSTDMLTEILAHEGETAGRRIERLCDEEDVEFIATGDLDATEAMGIQAAGGLLDLLQECVDADLGILYEPRDMLGLGYRTRATLYNQTAALALDYSAGETFNRLEPEEDDKNLANRVTASRKGGSSYTAELVTGSLSVQPPPDGVHPYEQSVTVNVETDAQLADHAGWRMHEGTVDEARWPRITVLLHNARIAADDGLVTQVLTAGLGDRLTVSNLLAQVPEDVSQLVQGLHETLRNPEHEIAFVCRPASPWNVATAGDAEQRADTTGAELAAGVGEAVTTFDVLTPVDTAQKWVTAPPPLNGNWSFEDDLDEWTGDGATLDRVAPPGPVADVPFGGSWVMQITPDGVTEFPNAGSDQYAVLPDAEYRLTGWVRCASARTVSLNINWFDGTNSYLSTSSNDLAVAADTWTWMEQTATAPATAAYINAAPT